MLGQRRDEGGLPRLRGFDASHALTREGCPFAARHCRELRAPGFRARIGLRPVVFLSGVVASREFYQPARWTRPDEGRLAGDASLSRLLGPTSVRRLAEAFTARFEAALGGWRRDEPVALLPEVERCATAAVCRWAGIALREEHLDARSRDLAALVDGVGPLGPRRWHAPAARARCLAWAREQVDAVRAMPPDSRADDPLRLFALHQVALARDAAGRRLGRNEAALALLRILVDALAASRTVAFAAHALHGDLAERERLLAGGREARRAFAHEVHRLYPLVPLARARVSEPFEFHGHRFERGARVVLDVWGTNRDSTHWGDAHDFRSSRFLDGSGDASDVASADRGTWVEPLTLALAERAAPLLAAVPFTVPAEDLALDHRRVPARLEHGLRVARLRPRERQLELSHR